MLDSLLERLNIHMLSSNDKLRGMPCIRVPVSSSSTLATSVSGRDTGGNRTAISFSTTQMQILTVCSSQSHLLIHLLTKPSHALPQGGVGQVLSSAGSQHAACLRGQHWASEPWAFHGCSLSTWHRMATFQSRKFLPCRQLLCSQSQTKHNPGFLLGKGLCGGSATSLSHSSPCTTSFQTAAAFLPSPRQQRADTPVSQEMSPLRRLPLRGEGGEGEGRKGRKKGKEEAPPPPFRAPPHAGASLPAGGCGGFPSARWRQGDGPGPRRGASAPGPRHGRGGTGPGLGAPWRAAPRPGAEGAAGGLRQRRRVPAPRSPRRHRPSRPRGRDGAGPRLWLPLRPPPPRGRVVPH